jgi:hypothetical protein
MKRARTNKHRRRRRRRQTRRQKQRGGDQFFQDLSTENESRATTFATANANEPDSLPTLMTVNKVSKFLGTA